jgi:LuxR family maltose regulon positive regulatory protein
LVPTSVLGRFTPKLCDAVLGREDSARGARRGIERSNMFLVALDAQGEWYRYHHRFGEVLMLEPGPAAAPMLLRRATAWCRAHGLIEDTIEYARGAGDAETVAELLFENHLEFIWGGRIRQFLGWVRRLPSELLLEYPLLLALGATTAALLARPEVEVQRLLAVAKQAWGARPELWSPYVEAVAEVTRAEVVGRGEVGAAVEHGRRTVAAARPGADVLTVGVLASLSQALLLAGDLDESRRVAVEAIERPDAPDVPDAYLGSLRLLALVDDEQGRNDSAERSAREAIRVARQRFQADS